MNSTRSNPRVEGGVLYLPGTTADHIDLDTPLWYMWLEEHSSFAFSDSVGHFTARKERTQRGSGYWKAYRKQGGKLNSAYLGRSADLSYARLLAVAQTLAARSPAPATAGASPAPLASAEPAPSLVAPADTLLCTKFFVPLPRPQRVVRERLLARLRNDQQRPLVLVVAPAGYGKTTLIADWIATDQRTAAWFALDSSDNDPIRFWTSVAATLDLLQPGVGRRVLRLLQSAQVPAVTALLPVLLNDLATQLQGDARGQPALLVLDDYHVIEQRNIHETVATLIEHCPPQLRLVLTTRNNPMLPLPRLRVRNQVTEIRAPDLAFTVAETETFLNESMGLTLDGAAAAQLTAYTEGWVAALQLVALSAQNTPLPPAQPSRFSHNNRQILGYLFEEVLAHQPSPVQQFLLHTAIFERMCADLCAVVWPMADATLPPANPNAPLPSTQQMLNHLLQANLFVTPLDDQHHWYRYHQLFAEALRYRLRTTAPDLERGLHRRAAEWFERNGHHAEAVAHALAGHDWERATRLIASASEMMWRRSEFGTLEAWLDALPVEYIQTQPQLGLARAMVLCATNQIETIEPLLAMIEQQLAHTPNSLATPVALLQAQLRAIRTRVARVMGNFDAAHSLAQQALTMLDPTANDWRAAVMADLSAVAYFSGDIEAARQSYSDLAALAQRANNYYLALFGLNTQASVLLDLGCLHETAALLDYTRNLAATWDALDLPIIGYNEGVSARLWYEWNDLPRAEQALNSAIAHARTGRLMEFLGFCFLLMTMLRLAEGNGTAAQHALTEAATIFGQLSSFGRSPVAWRRLVIPAWQALVQAMQGNTTALLRPAAEIAALLAPETIPLASWYYRPLLTIQIHASMLRGDSITALDLIDAAQTRAEQRHYAEAVIDLLTLRALVLDQCGQRSDALVALLRALEMGIPEGYVRMFVDKGAALGQLLRAALPALASRPALQRGVQTILAALPAFTTATAPTTPATELIEPLSSRERQILQLMAEGYSNQHIAQNLVLAVSTVKWHIKILYQKLAVQSRTQAVARARQFGLLN